MQLESRKYWLAIAAAVVAFMAVVATFAVFMQQTSSRIVAQNDQYITSATQQTAKLVGAYMQNAQKDIEMVARLASESSQVSDIIEDDEWLEVVGSMAPFDSVEFIDATGALIDDGEIIDVSDRDYFKRAMQGESGVQAVFNSRVTHENLACFYAPVRRGIDGPVVGLLLAHYYENRMAELLETSFFGYESDVHLCLPTGEVLASTDLHRTGTNLLDEARGIVANGTGGSLAVEASEQLIRAVESRGSASFSYEADDGVATACVAPVPGMDWMVVESFPGAATTAMIDQANRSGWRALGVLVLVFLAVVVGIVAYSNRKHRFLTRQMRDRADVQTGLDKLAERTALLDVSQDRFRYVAGPLAKDGRAPDQGTYQDMVDRIVDMVVGDEAKAEVREALSAERLLARMAAGEDNVRFEYQVDRNGALKWEDLNFICVSRDRDGRPLRVVYITQDVTPLKKREKQLQQAMEDSYRSAVAANHAKSDFLSRMSHDIRTPMNAIIGMTELARMNEGDPAKVDDCLAKIMVSSNHLLGLINEVLDLSMIESGHLALSAGEVDLRDLMTEIETVFAQRCQECDQHFSMETENLEHPLVVGDELRLQQVFINMLGNAVKFTPPGGSVSAKIVERPSRVEDCSNYDFVFSDTGCGMAPEFVEHVFEPFSREHDSRTEHVEGTGLGLSIARNIVSLMGGTIEVDTAPGTGTTFTVHVELRHVDNAPVQDVASDGAEAPAQDGSAAEDGRKAVSFDGKRALLVEDNELNSEIAKALLESLGMQVEVAVNGQEALVMYETTPARHFDVVMMDIQMPVMNGLEATRRIRAAGRDDSASLPIVVLSANAFTEDVQESKRAGADEHISKPISVKALTDVLTEVMGA